MKPSPSKASNSPLQSSPSFVPPHLSTGRVRQAPIVPGRTKAQVEEEKQQKEKEKSRSRAASISLYRQLIVDRVHSRPPDMEDDETAERVIRERLETEQDNLRLWCVYAYVLALQRKLSRAESAYKAALSIQSDYVPAIRGLGYMYHAIANEPDAAMEMYKRALLCDPEDVRTLCYLAVLLLDHKNDVAEAKILINRAKTQSPKDPLVNALYGALLDSSYDTELEARRAYSTSLAIRDDSDVKQRMDEVTEKFHNVRKSLGLVRDLPRDKSVVWF